MARGEFIGNEAAGRLQAQWTREAFTGNGLKDRHDMRSQHLADKNADLKAFTPKQLRDKEELVGLSHGTDFKQARETEEINQLLRGQRSAFQDVMRADARMQLEPQMWAAYDRMLGKEGKQQVLKAIEAKIGKAEQVEASAMEKVQATAEIQTEASNLLAQAPEALLIAGGAGLALWVINKLPISGAFKVVSLGVVMSIVLSACGTAAGTPTPEVLNPSAPVATEVSGGQATEAVVVATETTAPTATEVVLTLDQQIDAFMAGSIEFPSDLSAEEYKAFIEGMNESRGSKPIWVEGTTDTGAKIVLYYDEAKGEMVELKGTYAENKAVIEQNTWNQYVELSSDAEGNLQYVNPDTGEMVSVPGSAGMDWNMVIDETNFDSASIDWPTGQNKAGLEAREYYKYTIVGSAVRVDGSAPPDRDPGETSNLIPGILIDNSPFMLSRPFSKYGCLEVIFVRTDASGKPIYGVRAFVGPQAAINISEEGKPFNPKNKILQGVNEFEDIKAGVYYIALAPDQQLLWDKYNMADIDSLENVTSEANAYDAAVNDPTPDENVVLTSGFMIKKK